MEEKREVSTVTIPIDEYFNLRQKAEMNSLIIERIGRMENHLMDIERRLYKLENKQKKNGNNNFN